MQPNYTFDRTADSHALAARPRNRGALSVGFSGGFQFQPPGQRRADREWAGDRSLLGPPTTISVSRKGFHHFPQTSTLGVCAW